MRRFIWKAPKRVKVKPPAFLMQRCGHAFNAANCPICPHCRVNVAKLAPLPRRKAA